MNTVIAIYRVCEGRQQEFFDLLRQHYPTLHELGLVTDQQPVVYSGAEQEGGPIVFEIFEWKDAEAPDVAHQTPEVMRIWEALGTMTEEREGRPSMMFPHVERKELSLDAS